MAKRGKGKRRVSRRSRVRKRLRTMRVPFEVPIGLLATPFIPPAPGWGTPFDSAKEGNMENTVKRIAKGFIGMNEDGSINLWSALNPFDTNDARYSKIILAAGLIGGVRRKLSGKYTDPLVRKIPWVGRILG